ncbi:unnamed protein product [Notodromas monacha]|uniref:Uncharacterized protein n=1 Tax=Notodromas monacha TaxID=399045 RepID=A0A7R9BNH6_9CRUS|nr:unnamed protein product [Notodromas monacha]CAG0917655.1 unnamed protein product [Notodromas monacha]
MDQSLPAFIEQLECAGGVRAVLALGASVPLALGPGCNTFLTEPMDLDVQGVPLIPLRYKGAPIYDQRSQEFLGDFVWVDTSGALAYAELGGVIPRNGGEFVYFLDSMKDLHPVAGPLPGFLFIWVSVLLLKPSSQAILMLTFSKYLLYPIWNDLRDVDLNNPECSDINEWSNRIVAAACTVLVAFINCYNVKLATRVQNFFTAAKLAAIAIIVIGGIYKISQGNHGNLAADFDKTGEVGQIASAFYSGLWAYDGWNLPRAIMIALPLVTICYILVNIAYLSVMTASEIIASQAVAVTFGERVLGKAAFIMPLAVAFSTFGAANGSAFTIKSAQGIKGPRCLKEKEVVPLGAFVGSRSRGNPSVASLLGYTAQQLQDANPEADRAPGLPHCGKPGQEQRKPFLAAIAGSRSLRGFGRKNY